MQVRARRALLLLTTVALMAAGVLAQDAPRVVGIDVVGNRVATKSLIMGVTSIDVGSPLTPTQIQESIRRLYSLGIFRDVSIRGEDVTGGIQVFIAVEELPKLTGLEFEGNDKFNSEDLTEKLGLGVGGYISPFLVHKKKQEIRDLYAGKGYFQAQVTSKLTYNKDSTGASLTYKITEHSKVKVESVVMTGNKLVEADDLIGKMRNRKRGLLRSSDFAQDKFDEDLEKVIEEYHKKGFIDAYMISDSMKIDSTRNRMTIFLEVYEGPQYYFGEVTIEGNEIIRTEYLNGKLKYKKWDIFDAEKYQESLVELYTAYQEIGHLHIRVNDERTTVDDSILNISYTITEGLPSSINLVKIVGNKRTKDKVIRREISIVPGQTFNRSLLIRSVRDIMALNYFSNVEPVPVDLPNGDVDLEFKVEEKQTGQVSAGAGYNSQDKLVGTLGMGIPNFRGMGQNVSFNVEFGSRRNSFSVSFTEPWAFGRPTLLGTDIYSINRRWFEDYTESRQGGALRLGRRLRWPDNYFRIVASYRLERTRYHDFDQFFINSNSYKNEYWFDTNNDSLFNSQSVPVNNVPVQDFRATEYGAPYPGSILEYNNNWRGVSRVSFSIIRDSRNLPEFATNGSRFEYTISATGGPLGGYYEYQKHQFEFAKFFPIVGNLALAAKVQIGAIRKASNDPNDEKILLSDRFTPGGTAYDGIVRGYDDGVLTPDSLVTNVDSIFYYYDSTGTNVRPADSTQNSGQFTTRVRGKYMIVSNIELQFPLLPQQLYAIAFWDAGNSWLNHDDIQPFKLYSGMGLGFRLMVPGIGTIGFDFAKPLQDFKGKGKGWHAHFQIGTTFR